MPTLLGTSSLITVKRSFEFCIEPASASQMDYDFKRRTDERYQVDHTLSAQIGPYPIANGTPQPVNFQAITTASLLYLETNGPVDLVFNGGTDRIRLQPPKVPAGSAPRLGRMMLDGEYTSLTIENPIAAGDPPCVTGYLLGDA